MKEIFDKLLILYPDYSRIYGPYTRKDGRKIILLYKQNLSGKRTLSWPKALVEVREGRRLTKDETVDHNDRDFTNDSLDNLIIRYRSDHAKLDSLHMVVGIEAHCVLCNKVLYLTKDQIKTTRIAGPFCSRTCSGKYGKAVQKGSPRIKRIKIQPTYMLLPKYNS